MSVCKDPTEVTLGQGKVNPAASECRVGLGGAEKDPYEP